MSLGQPSWQDKDHRGFSLAARARYLVALAGDGRDQALLAVVLKESPSISRAPGGMVGKTMHVRSPTEGRSAAGCRTFVPVHRTFAAPQLPSVGVFMTGTWESP